LVQAQSPWLERLQADACLSYKATALSFAHLGFFLILLKQQHCLKIVTKQIINDGCDTKHMDGLVAQLIGRYGQRILFCIPPVAEERD